jgi:hypothetical protein
VGTGGDWARIGANPGADVVAVHGRQGPREINVALRDLAANTRCKKYSVMIVGAGDGGRAQTGRPVEELGLFGGTQRGRRARNAAGFGWGVGNGKPHI